MTRLDLQPNIETNYVHL